MSETDMNTIVVAAGIIATAAFAVYGIIRKYIYDELDRDKNEITKKADNDFEVNVVNYYDKRTDTRTEREVFFKKLQNIQSIKYRLNETLELTGSYLFIFSGIAFVLPLFGIYFGSIQNLPTAWLCIDASILLIGVIIFSSFRAHNNKLDIKSYFENKKLEKMTTTGDY